MGTQRCLKCLERFGHLDKHHHLRVRGHHQLTFFIEPLMASTTTPRKNDTLLSRRQIEGLIADGRSIIIVNGEVLKVDPWLKYHPGGDKAIRHMVGRDATDEVTALHSLEAQKQVQRYRIGRFDGRWANFVPPIQGGRFRQYCEATSEEESEEDYPEHQAPSSDISRAPSPVFDTVEPTARRCIHSRDDPLLSSASSISSTTEPEDGMSYLDAQTKEQINLDIAKYPSLDLNTQDEVVQKYRLLDQRLKEEHLYDCNYTAYAIEGCRYTFLFCMMLLFLRLGWYATSGLFLGCLWHQLVFTVHDAGHMGITHNFHIDSCIGIFIANFLGGLSCCWWKRNHNVHHIVTNSAEHDPDIQHMPFFAISHRFFSSLKSTYYDRVMTYDPVAKFMLKYQHLMYYPLLTFGRFNLYVLSWTYIFGLQGPRKGPAWWHRYLEIAGQLFFWYWYAYLTVYQSIPSGWSRFGFVMISNMIAMPVHVQITLSHFAMSTADLGVAESFPQRMLRTTMDVDCPWWLDFFHGGLQFQAVHHLFPRLPRHNLRAAQKLVMEFCQEVKIPYVIYGFAEGNGKVIGHLGEVAKQARIMAECQRGMSAKDVFEAH